LRVRFGKVVIIVFFLRVNIRMRYRDVKKERSMIVVMWFGENLEVMYNIGVMSKD